jgi:hypothetical protein
MDMRSDAADAMVAAIPQGAPARPRRPLAVLLLHLPKADYISGQTLLVSGGLTG